MTTTYIALIADVAASRALPAPARARLQARVRDVARELNARYRAHLAARFAVTLGDELQGLFKTAAPVWEVSHRLRSAFPEVDWVVACGRGALSTPLRRDATAPELDGPDRARVRDVARELNARYRAHLAARFAVTLGDELQGLFKTAAPVWEVSHRLRSAFPEVDWVVACGRGALSTPLRRDATAPELDGPCF